MTEHCDVIIVGTGAGGASVLDENCKAYEVDNLYVVDTRFFPSIGAVNPALTAMANAIRVGEHLTERLA
jgi:choline dehydrogenase-like flavoprotein